MHHTTPPALTRSTEGLCPLVLRWKIYKQNMLGQAGGTMTLIWWPGRLSVRLMRIDLRLAILRDSPSIWMCVTSSCSVCLSSTSKGPAPWASLAPVLQHRSRPSPSSFLQARNSILPSLCAWEVNFLVCSVAVQVESVSHMSRSPAMQLVALRHTKPRYFFLMWWERASLRSISRVLALLSSSSIQLLLFSLSRSAPNSPEHSVNPSSFFFSYFIGLKKFTRPTIAYRNLLNKAQRVRIFYTVYTILASKPNPTQFENTFLIEFSSLLNYLQSLISQILPFLQVSMVTSQISYLSSSAWIHF